jgi:hypothetical protein
MAPLYDLGSYEDSAARPCTCSSTVTMSSPPGESEHMNPLS